MSEQATISGPGTGYQFQKRSKLAATLSCRCPRCRQGRMFPHGTYNLGKFGKMHTECQVCGQDFKIEPGFYFGASYFSYGLNVALIIAAVAIFFTFFNEYSEWYLIGIIIAANLLLLPVNFRQSRSMMLHFGAGIKYQPESIGQE